MARRYTLQEACAYTRWLATHHYENFHVVSFLLPKRLAVEATASNKKIVEQERDAYLRKEAKAKG